MLTVATSSDYSHVVSVNIREFVPRVMLMRAKKNE
jgi:hypothetical protein